MPTNKNESSYRCKIAKICRDYRITIGYTRAQAARESGYSQTTFYRFEQTGYGSVGVFMWYIQHGLNVSLALTENRCVCCGELIPEGRQVCPLCEEIARRYNNNED